MFTGIVEEVGRLRSLSVGGTSAVLEIVARRVLQGTNVGDSIMTDGVCLTVTALGGGSFRADAMPETVRRTTLSRLRPGDGLNLERALTASSRLGGHLVSGHVDGVGTVRAVRREDVAQWLDIEAPPEVARLCVPRGSVTVSGVSLTVVAVEGAVVRVSLIPHTAAETTLGGMSARNVVNLEADMLARYVDHFLRFRGGDAASGGGEAPEGKRNDNAGGLTWEQLAGAGFE
jgi:riboflavin synthase